MDQGHEDEYGKNCRHGKKEGQPCWLPFFGLTENGPLRGAIRDLPRRAERPDHVPVGEMGSEFAPTPVGALSSTIVLSTSAVTAIPVLLSLGLP